MTRILTIAALLTTSLVLANDSSANGPKGNGHDNSRSHGISSFKAHSGRTYDCYRGHDQHWSSWRWNERNHCYFYRCPTTNRDFYWYAPTGCYYPVVCLTEYPPTPVRYQPVVSGVCPLPIVTTTTTVQVTTVVQVTSGVQTGGSTPIASVGGLPQRSMPGAP
jgi:hypothetical protein